MADYCQVCGKGVVHGHSVSHSNRKTGRTWAPNIQKVRALVKGRPVRLSVCSRCLRSGKVQRSV
ncbi:MAG: 50S ribosomal protein L28 [Bacillota bacterium]